MFSTFKSWFTGTNTTKEAWNGTREDKTMKATIQPIGEKFGLFTGGNLVGTFTRRRDAIRGATRRELYVTNG